jgi:hypothetical protein
MERVESYLTSVHFKQLSADNHLLLGRGQRHTWYWVRTAEMQHYRKSETDLSDLV